MKPATALIDHIGILVPKLEAAIERWSAVTGYEFSPIARYRTTNYSDFSDRNVHAHDTRISFSREGTPFIELMEVTGSGTHGPAQLGVHHIGFRVDDVEERIGVCAALGIGLDGQSFTPDGRTHLAFTDPGALDGLRLEFIAPFPGPTVRDDGGELWLDPSTGRKSFWPRPTLPDKSSADRSQTRP